jgi:DNA-binding CsgD family transcriptional regulator
MATSPNLVDVLFDAVTERRKLSYAERQELRLRVSDRLREIVPYVEIESQQGHLDKHIERMASHLKYGSGTVKEAENPRALSYFECDVLAGMLLGKTDDETARVLRVSHATVTKYALTAVHKLGARNRVHAVARVFAAVMSDATVGKSSLNVDSAERYNVGDAGREKQPRPDARLDVGRATGVTEALDVAASLDGGRRWHSGASA